MGNDEMNDALDDAIASWKGIKYFVEQKHLNEMDVEVKIPIYPEDLKMLGVILDAVTTRAAQGLVGAWQPIETAPKPVGFEEIWILGSDGCDVRTTRWCTEYPHTEGVWFLNYEPTDYISNINYWFPTHWMPLPAAPKKED